VAVELAITVQDLVQVELVAVGMVLRGQPLEPLELLILAVAVAVAENKAVREELVVMAVQALLFLN
jgi:hypothetical protein